MKNSLLFSIITISLNTKSDLEKTIKSISNQSYKDFEFIIVDGGSNDGSVELIKETNAVTKWVSESDKGRYDAMNKGIKMSSGKYLLFLNSGDVLVDSNVLANVAAHKLNKQVYFGNLLLDKGNQEEPFEVNFGNATISKELLLEYALPHQATFFHKDVFKNYGLYDDTYVICGDHDFFLRLIKNNVGINYLPVNITLYDMQGISSSPHSLELSKQEKAKSFDTNFGYPIVHFFTIVLYGQPFIQYHINIFKKLPFTWHWHIVEGASDLTHDTGWSLPNGAKVPHEFHKKGRSIDGTGEYIDQLKKQYPDNITIYRKPSGKLWDGKTEMVSAPLQNIKEECLLWQIDADEYWTADQIERGRELFMLNPQKTAAFYMSYVFVGEKLVLNSFQSYGNTLQHEWMRTWRFKPGDKWVAHEPPMLGRKNEFGDIIDVAQINPFEHIETESNNLVFQHFAYVTDAQLKFKESFYGYKDALKKWKDLNNSKIFPIPLKKYFDWVKDNTLVRTAKSLGIEPLLVKDKSGNWKNIIDARTTMPQLHSYRYLLAQKSVADRKELTGSMNPTDAEILRLKDELRKKEMDLSIIHNSKGWKLILKVRRMIGKVLPAGGKGRRLIKFGISLPKRLYILIKKIILRIFYNKHGVSRVLLLKAFRDKFTIMRELRNKVKGRKVAPVIFPPVPPFKYKPDHFIDWLRFANAGMQNDGNIFCFEYAIANLPSDKPIIEIGSFCGLSTNLMNFYITKNKKNNKIYTCDKWIFEGAENQSGKLGTSNFTNSKYRDFVKDSYMRNTEFFSKDNLPHTIECFSDEFFTYWEANKKVDDIFGNKSQLGGEISFAYIDGNHSYEYAKKDFLNVDKFLEVGGFILFDDSADGSDWGVCKVIDEIKAEGRYEVLVNNPNYLLRKLR